MTLGDKIKSDIQRKIVGLQSLGLAIGKDLEREARSNASWTDRTGNTRRSIHGGADRSGKGVVVYLGHGSEVGAYLEEGTGIYGPKGRPYDIRPKNKKALRFVVNGKEVFAKRVTHPGISPRPVVGPTVESNFPKIKEVVRRYWEGT